MRRKAENGPSPSSPPGARPSNDLRIARSGTRAHWIKGIARDLLLTTSVLALIGGGAYLYLGVWPPVVVVESSSMQHGSESHLRIIDTGDMVLVKRVDSRSDVVSYIEARFDFSSNRYKEKRYGDYGDVIIYRKNGEDATPVIHRAMFWLEYNATSGGWDLPELYAYTRKLGASMNDASPLVLKRADGSFARDARNVSMVIVRDVGPNPRVDFALSQVSRVFEGGHGSQRPNSMPHGGYITLGDNNNGRWDQASLFDASGYLTEPVKIEWIEGRAVGEIPWIGLIRLKMLGDLPDDYPRNSCTNLVIALLIIVPLPFVLDWALGRYMAARNARRGEDQEEAEEHEAEPLRGGGDRRRRR